MAAPTQVEGVPSGHQVGVDKYFSSYYKYFYAGASRVRGGGGGAVLHQ